MMVLNVQTQPGFSAGAPSALFEGNYEYSWHNPNYDVTLDAQHFVMIKSNEEPAPKQINVVVNWFEELERRVPWGKK